MSKSETAEIILFNKPFKVMSQFSRPDGSDKSVLADFINEKGFYPAGRLDFDSEGLMILTDNGIIQDYLAHPKHNKSKTYLVQVEGEITEKGIRQLQSGVTLKDGVTKPAKAKIITPPTVWDRHPPIRERKNIPTSWIALTICEGKNRQVRRMTAAVGYPTLRLIRHRIGEWALDIDDLNPLSMGDDKHAGSDMTVSYHLEPGEYTKVQIAIPSDILKSKHKDNSAHPTGHKQKRFPKGRKPTAKTHRTHRKFNK